MRTMLTLVLVVLVSSPAAAALAVYRGPLNDPIAGSEGRLTARVRTNGSQLRANLRCRGACVVRRGRITATYDVGSSSVSGTLRSRGRTCAFQGYLYLRFFQGDFDCTPGQIPQPPGALGTFYLEKP